MRGIDRLLAGVLLVGAVGGAAVFARESGSDSSVPAVELAAPPLQHLGAPGTVLFTQTPPRVAARVRGHQVRQAAEPPTQPKTTAEAQPARPTPPPPPGPLQTATAPVQVPPPPRSLAAVQIAPTPSTCDKSHGRALGHAKQHGHAQPQAVAAPVAATAAVPAPAQDDGTGGSDTAGPGNGHGNAWGHGNDRAKPDGD